jgi:3'-phosphoadenosine 5'-phosphosulfate sulfotransferase (PAPS reductase)/FAD synthetase
MKQVIVPVSGGKDSQACLKLACEAVGSENVLGLFCDTQFEHPLTYKHIETLEYIYKVVIVSITGGSVPDKVLKYKRFPGGGLGTVPMNLRLGKLRFS